MSGTSRAVVDIIERMLNRFAFCMLVSITAAEGAVVVVKDLSLRFRRLILQARFNASGMGGRCSPSPSRLYGTHFRSLKGFWDRP